MKEKLYNIISKFKKAKVLVIGDLILDEFIWGNVNRISPEAPVPVVKVVSESYVPGGAANVANNIAALGAQVWVTGIVGRDNNAQVLLGELSRRNVRTEGIFKDNNRPTTLKTRIIAHHQQVVRIDKEKSDHSDTRIVNQMLDFVKEKIKEVEAVLIEDYGKGVISPAFLKKVGFLAKQHKKIVTVDPKEAHFSYYRGATVITPNRHEALSAANMKDESREGIEKCGLYLLNKLKTKAVLITLGEEGMCLFEDNKKITHIPTTAREVFDVSGAGDTVIAALTLALASGAKMKESAVLANYAAGIVVGKVGTAVCQFAELIEKIKRESGQE